MTSARPPGVALVAWRRVRLALVLVLALPACQYRPVELDPDASRPHVDAARDPDAGNDGGTDAAPPVDAGNFDAAIDAAVN